MESSEHLIESKEDESDSSFPELLHFASRVQTLISELLLLSDRIPPEFRDRSFDPVLFDLRYFNSPDAFDARIEGNVELEALEDKFRESCSAFMQRFFLLANGAVMYHRELLKYLNDLQEGVYLQCTLDRVLENEFGRQLLAESIALFGCLLLLMEHCMSGFLREKLLVAHVRHDQCFDSPNLEQICLLCRVHPVISGPFRQVHSPPLTFTMVSVHKPEDLFARFPFSKSVVDAVICRLRDDDPNNQVRHYPDPQHRTVAFSSQAGSLYLLLFYSPEFLHNGFVMRNIVDRFFKDCWVVPIFMYFSIDLFVSWDAYKEAKASLSSCLSPSFIRDRSQLHCTKVKEIFSELGLVLSKGILTKDYVLNNTQHLFSLVRHCNVSMRWLLLHKFSIEKKLRDIVISVGITHQIDEDFLLLLLLKASQLEFQLKQLYAELLEGKEALWHKNKSFASDCINELSGHYSGTVASSCKIKNESLVDWFGKLSLEVCSLDCKRTGDSGRRIYRLISALKDVEQFDQIEENLQVKHQLSRVLKYLQDMLKALNLDRDTMSTLSVITDAVYAWGYMARFNELLNKKIEQDSSVVLILHSFFLKFRSIVDVPLLRIAQNQSPDLHCVLNYYSSKYVAQVCGILEIIPVMMFRIFGDDGVRTHQTFHPPDRIEKDNLQEFMQLDVQLNLAKAANKICIFSQGIQVMSRNFLDLIDLDVKDWLEGQIRKELSKRLEKKLKSFFILPSAGLEELEDSLRTLSTYIISQLHMMESFQDLLHIHGNSIWEEVFTKLLKHCAQEEHDEYIRRKQDLVVPHVQLNDRPKAQTFFGHLMHQVLRLTNPSRSMFIEPMSGWFDAEGHELIGLHFFDLLESSVGPVGMASLDSLLTVLVKENLEHSMRGLKNLLDARCLEELQKLDEYLGPATSLPLLGWSAYKQAVKIVDTSWEPWIKCLACIGQLQLLRCLVSLKLKSACKVKAGVVSFAAEGMIASILSQREKLLKCMDSKGENDEVIRHFIQALNKQGKLCGFFSPIQTVYISQDPPAFLSRCASVFTISQLSRYVLDSHLGTLTSRSKKAILDFSPVVIGLGTFLTQFHPIYMTKYVQYMGQYVQTTAEIAFGALYEPQKGSANPASEVLKSVFWLMFFCKHMGVPKDLVDSCLPPSLSAVLQT